MPTAPLPIPAVPDHPVAEHAQVQDKTCSHCRTPIPADGVFAPISFIFEGAAHGDSASVCRLCQEKGLLACGGIQSTDSCLLDTESRADYGHRMLVGDVGSGVDRPSISRASTSEGATDSDVDIDEFPAGFVGDSRAGPDPLQHRLLSSVGSPSRRGRTGQESSITQHSPPPLRIQTFLQPVSAAYDRTPSTSPLSPDPLVDITRLRVRSRGCHSLYPGALFKGTQKSGRNSYDVTVNIVDVDFESSTLCGYLCIQGLTEDWPELTTYFDAEIIGSRYGFRTLDWGATEQDDLSHWACFPPFRHVKHEMQQRPGWTVDDRDRGAVFMRWKERFLVPDHRVQDITGASFAGFYYVCVDFNPQPNHPTSRPGPQQMPLSPESETDILRAKVDSPPRVMHRDSKEGSGRRSKSSRRSMSRGLRSGPRPAATMSGYYFHQNSEPYQQLSLVHVPDACETSFEFR